MEVGLPNIALKLTSASSRGPWRPSAAKAAAGEWRLQLNAALCERFGMALERRVKADDSNGRD
jgi:hypothetical protein